MKISTDSARNPKKDCSKIRNDRIVSIVRSFPRQYDADHVPSIDQQDCHAALRKMLNCLLLSRCARLRVNSKSCPFHRITSRRKITREMPSMYLPKTITITSKREVQLEIRSCR